VYQLHNVLNNKLVHGSSVDVHNEVNVVTRSQSRQQDQLSQQSVINNRTAIDINNCESNRNDVNDDTVIALSDADSCESVVDMSNDIIDVDCIPSVSPLTCQSKIDEFVEEQKLDESLSHARKLAKQNRSGYLFKNELMFHKEKRYGREFEALCVPLSRRKSVITMAHDDSHFNGKRTKERIIISGLYWPTVASDTDKYALPFFFGTQLSL